MSPKMMMERSLVFRVLYLIIFSFISIQSALAEMSQKDLISILRQFVQSGGNSRFIGTTGHSASREYLKKYLKELKTGALNEQAFNPDIEFAQKFYQADFDQKIEGKYPKTSEDYLKWSQFTKYMKTTVAKYAKFNAQNIVWERSGETDQYLMLGAHYDTVVHNSRTLKIDERALAPGADYNGSGVAIALALARHFSQIPKLKFGIKIIFFDMGAMANLGSYHYVQSMDAAAKAKSLGLLNLEMLGHDSIALDTQKKSGNMAAYMSTKDMPSYNHDQKLLDQLIIHDDACRDKVIFDVKANGFAQSDHWHFWQGGVGAITLSQNWEDDFNSKRYQTSDDFVETLNFDTLYGVYRYLACNLAKLVTSS